MTTVPNANEKRNGEFEFISDKNNSYTIMLSIKTNSYIELIASEKSNIFKKSFSNQYTLEQLKDIKYFILFDNLEEIFDEILDRIKNNEISLKENNNNLIISISLPISKIKEIKFELFEHKKDEKETISDLTKIILEVKKENEILKKELNDMKEKINLLFDNLYISNLDSLIIDNNMDYNKMLKAWINPFKNIKCELLYRLSRDGDQISTFHNLCDNKGPTLTLYEIEDGNKIGFYSPLSWDNHSKFKSDMETFMFNLTKFQKYKKTTNECSIYCYNDHGPWTKGFGCNVESLKKLSVIKVISSYFNNSINILPGISSGWKVYTVKELEVYKII